MWVAALESQNSKADCENVTCKSLSKEEIHLISQQATAIARYSAST